MDTLLSADNFCLSPSKVVYALENIAPKVKCPPNMWSDPNTRKSDAFCEFHQDRGHNTEDCHALRLEVETLLQQGHLKRLLTNKGSNTLAKGRELLGSPKQPSPTRTINMIIRGSDDTSINGIKFATTHKLKRSITHERRIMVDDGRRACIIHPQVLVQMRLEDKIGSCCITLTSFNNVVEWTSGEITLLVLAGGVTLETTFYIMHQDTLHNAIVGRPWKHPMRAFPSSLCQVIKFRTPWEYSAYEGNKERPGNAIGSHFSSLTI
nr:uncharacterized protein LOC104110957 [Nicotiana tomentosiformis]